MFDDTQRILVVDDDPEILELLADFLTKHGLEVTTVADSVAMDDALLRQKYDLVVLDLMLPGEDGLSIARRLKQNSPMPIIMLTALGDDVDRVVGLELGADDYVKKPFNPRILLARIRSVLRRKSNSAGTVSIHNGKILVVDDDLDTRKLLADYFVQQGFGVKTVADGRELDVELKRDDYDLIILDLKIPGESGFQIATRIRQDWDIPIIMMTAIGDEVEQVVGLELGADDYIDKPPNPRELLARVKAVLRRHQSNDAVQVRDGVYHFGDFVLDVQNYNFTTVQGETIPLTSGEFELLHVFAQHAYKTLNRDQLLDLLAEEGKSRIDRSIDVRVTRLRSKIETDPSNPLFIKTVWGKGYVFCPNET